MSATNTNTSDATETRLATAPPVAGDGFLVHTKHTCDVCLRQPLLGKRYASAARANFDLCARCHDAHRGPDLGLAEAALLRDKKHSRDFVLKLEIDKGGSVQVRRVPVSEIWDDSRLSFAQLMAIAAGYAFPKHKKKGAAGGLDAFIARTDVTYIDGDGDTITMTSSAELEECFLQVAREFPLGKPFRITVTVPPGYAHKGRVTHRFHGVTAGEVPLLTGRLQLRKIEGDESAGGGKPAETPPGATHSRKFERDLFVHARHTCDGCSKSPILGTRHHATKIADFDLCATCFEKYEGEDLDFEPAINDRDRCMQQRWLKKQLKETSKMASNVAGVWSQSNGDIFEFLKNMQESGDAGKGCRGRPRPSGEDRKSTGSPPVAQPGAVPAVEEAPAKEDQEPADDLPATQPEAVAAEETSGSPAARHDESFLSDAEGSGSIAAAIGRTLDGCVQEIERAMADGAGGDAAAGADDSLSVASSVASHMTDVLKRMDDARTARLVNVVAGAAGRKADGVPDDDDAPDGARGAAAAAARVPATVSKSDAGTLSFEMPELEDASDGDDWSVVSDDQARVKHGEGIALAENGPDKSVSSIEPLSPVVLAKWDTEIFQLHELGFFDDRKNVDVMEHLEASHMGVDSTEKVTVQNIVEHLLGRSA